MNPNPPRDKDPKKSGVTREIRAPEGKQASGAAADGDENGADLRTQYERDQSSDSTDDEPREVMRQAKKDIDAGLVDTDLRGTPGLDAERRRELLAREKSRSEENSRNKG